MKEEKIKRFIDCYLPVTTCNLRCHYCYITQKRQFYNELPKFKYSPEYIAKALTKERLGGTCLINICGGGETLLPPEIVDIIYCLLKEGHYITVVTNCTLTKRMKEILEKCKEFTNRLFFKCSFQYLELKRLNLLKTYFSNIEIIKKYKASFSSEITANDEIVEFIDEIKQISIENLGALPHITIARDDRFKEQPILTKYSMEDYKNIWKQFNSELFNVKMNLFSIQRKECCYAGDWVLFLNLENGELSKCHAGCRIDNIFEDLLRPINFKLFGYNCFLNYCYNGHVFLTLGAIPELLITNYSDVRNRICEDGTEWLQPEMKYFMSSKLCESNKHYSSTEIKELLKINTKKISLFKKIKYKILSKISFKIQTRKKYKEKYKNL